MTDNTTNSDEQEPDNTFIPPVMPSRYRPITTSNLDITVNGFNMREVVLDVLHEYKHILLSRDVAHIFD